MTPPQQPGDPPALSLPELTRALGAARWFGGKGTEFAVREVRALGSTEHCTAWEVRVAYDAHEERYAWWGLGHDRSPGPDASGDPEALGSLLAGFAATGPLGGSGGGFGGGSGGDSGVGPDGGPGGGPGSARLRHHLFPDGIGVLDDPKVAATARPLGVDQSNTSISYGDRGLLKLFRTLAPGPHPDIELHAVLTEAGSTDIARLLGWIESVPGDGPSGGGASEADGNPDNGVALAIAQEFLPDPVDGWALGVPLVDQDPAAFTGHSYALGAALRRIHGVLAERCPGNPHDARDLAAALTERLDAAASLVPELRRWRDPLAAHYDALEPLGTIPTHRIHGDFHLGQCLLSAGTEEPPRWRIVDFEGEPARPPAERRLPDSPWRDVAGMLRSLSYAEGAAVRRGTRPGPARTWRLAQTEAFLDGYLGRQLTPAERLLLDAYVADKAAYETVYETRNRPDWVALPVAALAEIGAR